MNNNIINDYYINLMKKIVPIMQAIIPNYVQALIRIPGARQNRISIIYIQCHVYLFAGAETPLYLALLPPGTTEPNGEYLYDKAIAKWRS